MVRKVIKNTFRGVTASLLFTSLLFNFNLIKKQRNLENVLIQEKEYFKIQSELYEQKAEQLLHDLEIKSDSINNLQKRINELETENSSLEAVQKNIINSVGYIPNHSERLLLEKIVECEAGGESLEGKIAVANVVLNRIKSNKFPNTISGVIYQPNQFEPVSTGVINNKIPSAESKEAVKRALLGEQAVKPNVLYFWASYLDSEHELWNHVNVVETIGVHCFGSEWN